MVESNSTSSANSSNRNVNIEAEINSMGMDLLERFDERTEVLDEPEKGYQVRKDQIDGCPVIAIKCRADGLTPEMVAPLIENPASVVTKMNNRMTVNRLQDDCDGNLQYHFSIETPTIAVYNRSMFVRYFIQKNEQTGCVTITSTSQGLEDLEAEHASLHQGNVVGNLIISYMTLQPTETGYHIEQVSCFDPKGWIPSFIQ